MDEKTKSRLKIAAGLRKLEDRYFDYLYSLKSIFNTDETLSFTKFISESDEGENLVLIFKTIKGVTLRSDIKREINDLYTEVYKDKYL